MDDDAAQLRERIDKLEQIAVEQQETIDELENQSLLGSWGRRGVLGGIAAALGIASASGSAAAGVGDVGTPSERVDVFADTLDAEHLNNDYLFAAAFDGSDPDVRLDNALSAATEGDCIYLESDTYDANHTVNTSVSLRGTHTWGGVANATQFSGDLTLSNKCTLRDIGIKSAATVTINGRSVIEGSYGGGTITVDTDRCILRELRGQTIDLTSNSSLCIIDDGIELSITDNGTNNLIGNTVS